VMPRLAERRFDYWEWVGGRHNDYIDWYNLNDAWGLWREGAD